MSSIWRKILPALVAGLCVTPALAAAEVGAQQLTAEQIVDRNVAARGGLAAWRGVQSMQWAGKMDASSGNAVARSQAYVAQMWDKRSPTARGAALAAAEKGELAKPVAEAVQLPFVLELKRPGKARIELEFAGQTAIQVYDGKQGWMKRPYLNRDDWEAFSAEQAKASVGSWDLDGPLIDYAAKDSKVALEGAEKIDGSDTYRVKVTHKDGTVQHVWIDQKTFLDVRVEGTPRRMDGKLRPVWVTQRDFRQVDGGVMVPFVQETAVEGYRETHRMQLERVTVNPKLGDERFVKSGA